MSPPFAKNVVRVIEELTPAERESAIAYFAAKPVEEGARLAMPGVEIVAKARSLLVFVDQDPTANWTHPARYILLACDEAGQAVSIPARLPPFGQTGALDWQLAYRAAAVPDWAVVVR